MMAGASHAELLERLASAPRESLGDVVRQAGEPSHVISAAADEVERLAITDLAKAAMVSERLVWGSDQVAPSSARARARRARAQALAYSNRFEDALVVLREAVALADGAGDSMEGARVRMTTLHALARLGRYDEAIEAGETARGIFQEANERVLAARADINLGVSRRMSGHPTLALPHFDRARSNLAGQTILLAQLESNRAEALLDLGQFADAEAAFRTALDAFDSAGLTRASGIVEGNLGDLTSRQGRLQEALLHFERARRNLGDSDAPGDAARLEIEQAETLSAVGLGEEAIGAYERALPRVREHNLAWEEARGLLGLGRELARHHRDKAASEALRGAAHAFEQLGHAAGVGLVRVQEARLAGHSGDARTAESLLRAAIEMLCNRGPELVSARIELTLNLVALERLDDAEREGRLAVDGAASLSLGLLHAAALHALSLVYSRTERQAAAVTALRRAIVQIEAVRSRISADRVRASFHGGFAPVYSACLSAVLDQDLPGSMADAFEVAERASARSLLDLLDVGPGLDAVAPSSDPVEGELLSRLARERAALSAHHDRLFGDASRREGREHADQWKKAAVECERSVREIERRLASTSRFADVFAEPVGLSQLQSKLAPGVGLVQFVPEGDDLTVLAIDRDACHVRRRIASLARVGEMVGALYFQLFRVISRGPSLRDRAARFAADCERVLAQLQAILLGPLAPFVQAHPRLAVAPCSVLHAVPFHALIGAQGSARGGRCTSIVPSASVLSRLLDRAAKAAPSPHGGTVIIGVADELSPQAEREAAACAAAFRQARVILGKEATASSVREAIARARHIHIASHARFVPSDPLSSGIRLVDGWLTARDVFALDLRGATVVLSGCDSGRAIIDSSNEANGLVRAFLAAGASEMLMSLWPVHDEMTAQLMKTLYTFAGNGRPGHEPLSASLCRAQQEVRALEPHPALWAPFVRVGTP